MMFEINHDGRTYRVKLHRNGLPCEIRVPSAVVRCGWIKVWDAFSIRTASPKTAAFFEVVIDLAKDRREALLAFAPRFPLMR